MKEKGRRRKKKRMRSIRGKEERMGKMGWETIGKSIILTRRFSIEREALVPGEEKGWRCY